MTPRALSRACALATVLAVAGCIDFVDPNLPRPGTPLLQLSVHFLGTGQLALDATLQPGLAPSLEFRTVPNDSLLVNGRPLAPTTVHHNQARDYSATLPLPAPVGPVTVAAPLVTGIPDRPPPLVWFGVRRLDPDTVVLPSGADLHLHVDASAGPGVPPPIGRQWFLQLFAGGHMFQLGADGLPPPDLHVPIEFLPADSLGTFQASLLVLYSGQLDTARGDYLVNAQFDQHVIWTVIRPPKGVP